MHATTVAVDLAKSVFQIAIADDKSNVVAQERLTRSQFDRWFRNWEVGQVIMEACGSAHHWGRWFNRLGIPVKLLPAAYIRAYVKRNKTDSADARALLEAARCADIVPVQVKSLEQQALQGPHRIRSRWMATRTSRINSLGHDGAPSAMVERCRRIVSPRFRIEIAKNGRAQLGVQFDSAGHGDLLVKAIDDAAEGNNDLRIEMPA